MRLIAERIVLSPDRWGSTYVQGELVEKKSSYVLPKPVQGHRYHIYSSPYNVGGGALMSEFANACRLKLDMTGTPLPSPHHTKDRDVEHKGKRHKKSAILRVTERLDDLDSCDHMLVYLTALTWSSGNTTAALAGEVRQAMAKGVRLLLVHEMPGMGGQEIRQGCDFGDFFAPPPDGTPKDLLQGGIYAKIAIAMKGGAWRETSMVMLAHGLAALATGAPDEPNHFAPSSEVLQRFRPELKSLHRQATATFDSVYAYRKSGYRADDVSDPSQDTREESSKAKWLGNLAKLPSYSRARSPCLSKHAAFGSCGQISSGEGEIQEAELGASSKSMPPTTGSSPSSAPLRAAIGRDDSDDPFSATSTDSSRSVERKASFGRLGVGNPLERKASFGRLSVKSVGSSRPKISAPASDPLALPDPPWRLHHHSTSSLGKAHAPSPPSRERERHPSMVRLESLIGSQRERHARDHGEVQPTEVPPCASSAGAIPRSVTSDTTVSAVSQERVQIERSRLQAARSASISRV